MFYMESKNMQRSYSSQINEGIKSNLFMKCSGVEVLSIIKWE